MIPISYLFNDRQKEPQGENVDEGILGDIGYTIRQRTPFKKKAAMPSTLPSRNPALRRAAAVMNNRLR